MSPRTSLVLALTLCGLTAPVVAQDTLPTPSTDATTPDTFRDLTPPEVTGESETLVYTMSLMDSWILVRAVRATPIIF